MKAPVKLLCNWGACVDVCIAALLDVLGELRWDVPKPKATECLDTLAAEGALDSPSTSGSCDRFCLFDLGSGDGRVLTEVCKRFPGSRGVGIELNPNLVSAARARAKRESEDISERCEFRQEDFAKTRDLGLADAIFLYLPAAVLKHVL